MTVFAFVSAAMLALASAAALPQSASSSGELPCGSTSLTSYVVVSGDTLGSLAQKYNSGICDIASYNKISNPDVVYPGEKLQIPIKCTTPDNTSCLPKPAPAPNATCAVAVNSSYVVKSGDTMTLIAGNYKITLDALAAANKQILNINLIFPSQLINIPICDGSQCLVKTYKIKSGDTFFDLANKYGTTVGNIEGVNPSIDPTKLVPGQKILLPKHCKAGTQTE